MRPLKQKPIRPSPCSTTAGQKADQKRQSLERRRLNNRVSAAETRLKRSRQVQELEELIKRLSEENEVLKAENAEIKRRAASEAAISTLSSGGRPGFDSPSRGIFFCAA